MNIYAYERADGSVGTISAKAGIDPQDILPEGAVIMNQVSDLNPLPDVAHKAAWSDDGSGNVTIDVAKARTCKIDEIRAKRDKMMLNHDKQYLIAMKDSASTTDLDADRATLLDLPAAAQTALDALTDLDDIKNHDAFATLTLAGSYE